MTPLKVLVTGAKGFVGKNLCARLKTMGVETMEYDIDTPAELLDVYCAQADFVYNLAGVNRPKDPEEFRRGNFGFASTLLDTLRRHGNRCPVMLASSIQASLQGRYAGHPYGESKRAGEELFFAYGRETGAPVLVYRFPNLFGKWCRPNYNSVVATFCYNIARGLPILVNDPSTELELLYIDDLVDALVADLYSEGVAGLSDADPECFSPLPVTYRVTLGEIAELLTRFSEQPSTLMMPEMPPGSFAKKLYATYLSYLPEDKVAFPLTMHSDQRGSFTELIKSANLGQVSINISKPGITKGNHWHNTKWEQFIVVKGHGLIMQRSIAPLNPTTRGTGEGVVPGQANPLSYEILKEKAAEHRKSQTQAEGVMWQLLRNKGLEAKFRRQHVIGDYIVDFVCLDKGLVIEIDGGYHNKHDQREYDNERTRWLINQNYSVIRFTNEEVLCGTDNVIGIIKNALKHLPLVGGVRGAFVSGDRMEAVHMLPGYTHCIINLSDTDDLVTVMYCNEVFDPEHPDTFAENV